MGSTESTATMGVASVMLRRSSNTRVGGLEDLERGRYCKDFHGGSYDSSSGKV